MHSLSGSLQHDSLPAALFHFPQLLHKFKNLTPVLRIGLLLVQVSGFIFVPAHRKILELSADSYQLLAIIKQPHLLWLLLQLFLHLLCNKRVCVPGGGFRGNAHKKF